MLPTQPSALQSFERPCPRCGGSGVLRLGGQRWRTCLDCLGQGRITLLRPATSAPSAPPLSAAVSSAAR